MPALEKYYRKRSADSDPDGEPPIKKFSLLQIGPFHDGTNYEIAEKGSATEGPMRSSDSMLLDDTKHVSYVHDFDRQLQEIEAQEEQISFLPEIEKTLSAIPSSILKTPKPPNEIVLYTLPSSLSIPEERDSVRRAILESRARAAVQQDHVESCHTTKSDADYSDNVSQEISNLESSLSVDGTDSMDIDVKSSS